MARPEVTGRKLTDDVEEQLPHPPIRGPPRGSFTIEEFCTRHHLSRSEYFRIRKLGLGPDELRVAGNVRITAEADRKWGRRHTAKAAPIP